MNKYLRLRMFWVPLGLLLSIGALLLFATVRAQQMPCQGIHISVYPPTLHFLHPDSLRMSLARQMAMRPGLPSEQINLQRIEEHLQSFPFVSRVQARRNPNGNIHIELWQKKPIARLTRQGKSDQFITLKGELVPLTTGYAPRVMTIQLPDKMNTPMRARWIQDQLAFLTYIDTHPFWRAQIASIAYQPNGELLLYPQVTHQRIRMQANEKEFAAKLAQLYAFYTRVLPNKGWTTYKEIDLRFDHQIVCR